MSVDQNRDGFMKYAAPNHYRGTDLHSIDQQGRALFIEDKERACQGRSDPAMEMMGPEKPMRDWRKDYEMRVRLTMRGGRGGMTRQPGDGIDSL